MFFLEADSGSDEEGADEGVVKDGDKDNNQRSVLSILTSARIIKNGLEKY